MGRKQCTCTHGCHINGLITSSIDHQTCIVCSSDLCSVPRITPMVSLRGRPKRRWLDNIKNDLSERELSGEEAQDRVQWRHLYDVHRPHIKVGKEVKLGWSELGPDSTQLPNDAPYRPIKGYPYRTQPNICKHLWVLSRLT